MSISAVPWDVFHLESFSDTESLDKLLADENSSKKSVDQIIQKPAVEVEVTFDQDE